MNDGDIQTRQEVINEALKTLSDVGYNSKRDAFDIGLDSPGEQSTDLISMLSNPQQLVSQLGLTSKQAENVKSLVAGAGAGAGYKLLSNIIGGELAAAAGGFLGAYVSRRLLGK